MRKLDRVLCALLILAFVGFPIRSARAGGPGAVQGTIFQAFGGQPPSSAGTAGQFLQTNGAGILTWATVSASSGPFTLTTGVISPTVAGNQISNPIGSASAEAFGAGALAVNNASGAGNAAFGNGTLGSNTSGQSNTAFGTDALNTNVSNSFNTAIGYFALLNATASNNTAVGYFALENDQGGGNNTAIGYKSGLAPAGAAGNANTTGTNNTYLGYQTGANSNTQRTNTTTVGFQALTTADNQVSLGDLNVTTIHIAGTAAIEIQGDTGLSRDSAGVWDFGTGAAGSTAGSWKATNGTISGTLTLTSGAVTGGYAYNATAANGEKITYGSVMSSTTLSTGGLTTNTAQVPANSYVIGVSARVTTTITTTTNWSITDAASTNIYIPANGTLTSGTTAAGINLTATTTFYTAANTFVVKCTGSNPGAGVIRVTIFYVTVTPATS